jgi:cysteine desulfurase
MIVGLRVAVEIWYQRRFEREQQLCACRDLLETRLSALPDVVVNGSAPRLPHVLNVSFLGVDRQGLLMALDQEQLYCSSGSACASGSSEPSPVLRAMGLDPDRIRAAIRLSVGATSELALMPQAADRILNSVKRLRRTVPR